jgi:hypothetical protein
MKGKLDSRDETPQALIYVLSLEIDLEHKPITRWAPSPPEHPSRYHDLKSHLATA